MEGNNVFEKVNRWISGSEASIVNLLSAIAPWLAPLAPAYMSFYHMTRSMEFPGYIAWSIAAVVEVLGLSAVSTILTFWMHNRKYSSGHRQAPVWIAIFSFCFYLAIILTVNVLLDAAPIFGGQETSQWVLIGAKALLTLLSVPAAVLLAVRTAYKEMLDAIGTERAERKEARKQMLRDRRSNQVDQPQVGGSGKQQKRRFLDDWYAGRLQGVSMNGRTLAQMYGVSERNAWRWIAEVQNKNGGSVGQA